MTSVFAENFAKEWVASWNSKDLCRILSHYADDFEMTSPAIAQIMGESSGRLKGKASVGAYWERALKLIPDLRFELMNVFIGVDSLTIYYKGAKGRLATEVFHFDAAGKVHRAFAHYAA